MEISSTSDDVLASCEVDITDVTVFLSGVVTYVVDRSWSVDEMVTAGVENVVVADTWDEDLGVDCCITFV